MVAHVQKRLDTLYVLIKLSFIKLGKNQLHPWFLYEWGRVELCMCVIWFMCTCSQYYGRDKGAKGDKCNTALAV